MPRAIRSTKSRHGPAPKPTSLRVLEGEKRPSRIPANEPVPAELDVECPSYLDAEQRAVWDAYAPDLTRKGVLTFWDVEAFAAYCVAVVRHAQAVQTINATDSLLVRNQRGVARHPALAAERDQAMLMMALGSRFGLTPADRAVLGRSRGDAADETDDLFT